MKKRDTINKILRKFKTQPRCKKCSGGMILETEGKAWVLVCESCGYVMEGTK